MFRGLKQGGKDVLTFTFVILVISPLLFSGLQINASGIFEQSLFPSNLDATDNPTKIQTLEDLSSYTYTPVTNLTDTGKSFDVKDSISVYDDFLLNMTYNNETGYFEDNFTIQEK